MNNRMDQERDERRENMGSPGGSQSGQNTGRNLTSRERYNAKHGKKPQNEEQTGHIRNKERQIRSDHDEPNKPQ